MRLIKYDRFFATGSDAVQGGRRSACRITCSSPLAIRGGGLANDWRRLWNCPNLNAVYLPKSCMDMITSSNGNIFRVTGPLCGEFTCHQWIPRTKASDAELWCFLLICASNKRLSKQSWAGDLRRHRAHYDVIVMDASLALGQWWNTYHKFNTELSKYPTMHHFVTWMWTRAHFCFKMVHCGIWDWCILGFVQQVYWHSINR